MLTPRDLIDEGLGEQVADALAEFYRTRPRSVQSDEGTLGWSDVGGCREYARLRTVQAEPTDGKNTWPAQVGSALDAYMREVWDMRYPGTVWDDEPVTATLPNGATITGSPDVVGDGTVLDWKSKDGLATVTRNGPSEQHWMQVHGYALALHQAGHAGFDNLEWVTVSLVYVDRSGRTATPVAFTRSFDYGFIVQAEHWVEDVIYAVRHGEQASKDKPIEWCENWCPFFTGCRGRDIAPEGGLIDDPETVTLIEQYATASAAAKAAARLKDEAKAGLVGVNGSTGRYTVKWTRVNESQVAATVRAGYDRLAVREVTR